MPEKGQTSFEMILLVSAVLIITTAVLGRYVSVGDETIALATAKQSTIEILSTKNQPHLIQKIGFKHCENKTVLEIKTEPQTIIAGNDPYVDFTQTDTDKITGEVRRTTSFDSFEILVNAAEPC